MAIETIWRIAQLERQTDTGGVITAHWNVYSVDNEYTATVYGSVIFTPDPNAPDFVPYEQLTEADVLGWVWNSVGKDEIEADLASQIDAQKSPVTKVGLPWVVYESTQQEPE
jgi:hypothetical protein